MANDVGKNATDVYRYKITTEGRRRKWNGSRTYEYYDNFTEVTYRGYYQRKQSWTPWRKDGETITLELQKLEPAIADVPNGIGAILEWVTIRTKVLRDEEEDE